MFESKVCAKFAKCVEKCDVIRSSSASRRFWVTRRLSFDSKYPNELRLPISTLDWLRVSFVSIKSECSPRFVSSVSTSEYEKASCRAYQPLMSIIITGLPQFGVHPRSLKLLVTIDSVGDDGDQVPWKPCVVLCQFGCGAKPAVPWMGHFPGWISGQMFASGESFVFARRVFDLRIFRVMRVWWSPMLHHTCVRQQPVASFFTVWNFIYALISVTFKQRNILILDFLL